MTTRAVVEAAEREYARLIAEAKADGDHSRAEDLSKLLEEFRVLYRLGRFEE